MNLTDNQFYRGTVYFEPRVMGASVTGSVIYCSIRGNQARESIIFDFNINANYMLSHMNFISNYQIQTSYGLINIDGPVLVTHCTFLSNDLNTSHRWFSVQGGYFILFDLTIDAAYTSHVGRSVYTYFIQPFEGTSFINALEVEIKAKLL